MKKIEETSYLLRYRLLSFLLYAEFPPNATTMQHTIINYPYG